MYARQQAKQILNSFGSFNTYDNWCAENYLIEDNFFKELFEDAKADRIINEQKEHGYELR